MLEEKVVVLNTPMGKRFESAILALPGAKKIKTVKQNTFFYIDNGKTGIENVPLVTKTVESAPMGKAVMFKVYPIYRSKVDMDWKLPNSVKDGKAYYTEAKKDITEDEIAAAIA